MATKRKSLTIADMEEFARKKGGTCLSTTYINAKTKLTWECAKGHTWEAEPVRIISGRWCAKCAKEKQRKWNETKYR